MNSNKQAFKIKKATYKDIDQFWDLFKISVKEQFPEYSAKTKRFFLKKSYAKDKIREQVKNKIITLLIATNNNKIVGYLMASFPYGGISSILWLAVKDLFQDKGIGTSLLKKHENIARKQGAHKILLLITVKQKLKFYKKNGYKLIGYIPQAYFKMDNWWVYKEI